MHDRRGLYALVAGNNVSQLGNVVPVAMLTYGFLASRTTGRLEPAPAEL